MKKGILATCLVVASLCLCPKDGIAIEDKVTIDQVLASHLSSIGTPEARAASASS